jgi:hypothetical protein
MLALPPHEKYLLCVLGRPEDIVVRWPKIRGSIASVRLYYELLELNCRALQVAAHKPESSGTGKWVAITGRLEGNIGVLDRKRRLQLRWSGRLLTTCLKLAHGLRRC